MRIGADGREIRETSTSKNKAGKMRKVKRTGKTPKKPKALKTTCLACHRSKLESLPSPEVRQGKPGGGEDTEESARQEEPTAMASRSSANASSKARAKARKQGGLQTMLALAKSRQEEKGAGGLMDWMGEG